ncbi:YkvA family protein [uncultured Parabacteroides sp.]|uniref:YkvA family protein n=1 Tax=Parabacteroides goldsteinii TaxID=328812 RepID=UPI002599D601|nr:YkvA family protein [uncultured Parabacteroides sp.]
MSTNRIEDVPFEEVHEVQKYGTYYSDNRFWKKVERVAKKVGATVLLPVFTLYYMLQDDKVSLQHKTYIVGALGYFILPIDLIPDGILPVIGFTDDIAVMTLVLKLVKDSITPEIKARANARVSEIIGTDNL